MISVSILPASETGINVNTEFGKRPQPDFDSSTVETRAQQKMTRKTTMRAVATTTIQQATSEANRLWAQRLISVENYNRLSKEARQARETLPAWAKPGPRLIASDGSFHGHVVRHPLDEEVSLPGPSAYKVCRPSIKEAKQHFDDQMSMFPGMNDASRRVFRLAMWKKIKRRIELCRLQSKEIEVRGIPQLDEAIDAALEAFCTLERRIEEAVQTPDAKAAGVLIHLGINCANDESISSSSEVELAAKFIETLMPHLTGLIREHCELFLSDKDAELKTLPWTAA